MLNSFAAQLCLLTMFWGSLRSPPCDSQQPRLLYHMNHTFIAWIFMLQGLKSETGKQQKYDVRILFLFSLLLMEYMTNTIRYERVQFVYVCLFLDEFRFIAHAIETDFYEFFVFYSSFYWFDWFIGMSLFYVSK